MRGFFDMLLAFIAFMIVSTSFLAYAVSQSAVIGCGFLFGNAAIALITWQAVKE